MNIKTILRLAAILVLVQATGCMTRPKTTPPVFRAADFMQRQPASIAVLPLQDSRLSQENKVDLTKLAEAVSKTLSKYGYDVPPSGQPHVTSIGSETKTEEALKAEAQKFGAARKCDSVLFTRLDDYEAAYRVMYRTDRIEMHFILRETKTGDRLWEHHTSYHKTYVGGLVGSAIGGPALVMVLGIDWAGSLPPTKKQTLSTLGLW